MKYLQIILLLLSANISISQEQNEISLVVKDIYNTPPNGAAPKSKNEYSRGYFLPNDNWMVTGLGSDWQYYTKYFSAGTFDNRYAKLNLKDYISLKFNLNVYNSQPLNTNLGFLIIYGCDKDKVLEGKSQYYKYDLINDKITYVTEKQDKYYFFLDYNDKNKSLLLSENEYTYGYPITSNKILLVNGAKKIELNDNYKMAKFSNNGDYLLTINDMDTVEIRKLPENDIIYTKQLDKGDFTIQVIGDSGFVIGNSQFSNSTKYCYSQSLALEIIDQKVTSNVYDCSIISDASFVHNSTALLINDQAVTVNDKILNFPNGEGPLSVSLNSDASRLMISFKNGKIIVYDTATLKELGTMLHPDQNSHVFLDSQGHYFSNINAETYLSASIGNKKVPFQEIEKKAFDPEKILSLFGKPNEKYVETLNKAIAIRNQNTTEATTNTKSSSKPVALKSEKTGKPNLYLISIGVSDYQQSNYNLTFADKDAKDMAQIYGKFSPEEIKDYKDKFFGNVFSLRQKKDQTISKLKLHLGDYYKSAGNFYLLNPAVNSWLYIHNNKINLWNFDKQTVDSLTFANNSRLPYNIDDKIYPYPDASGFAIRDNEKVQNFSITNKKKEEYQLPKNSDSNNYQLLSEREWLIFDYGNSEGKTKITLAYHDIQSNVTNKRIELILDQYIIKKSTDNLQNGTFESYNLPNLKDVALNGKLVLFELNGALYMIDTTEKNPIPLQLNTDIKIEYGDLVKLSQDGKFYCVLKTNGEGFRYSTFRGSVDSSEVENQIFNDPKYSITGFSIYDAKPTWIEMSAPLLEDNYIDISDNKLLNDNTPFSFEKTYVINMVNNSANSKAIKNTLSHFFEKSKIEDQVMVFLAGHGVLDKNNVYYFAPTDMDFNNVTTNGISFEFIINALKNAPAANKLLLMDSCHSGNTLDITNSDSAVEQENTNKEQRGSKGNTTKEQAFKVSEIISSLFENFLSKSGVTVVSASAGSDVAYENKQLGNGAFTASYIKLLKEKLSAGITLEQDELKRSLPLTKEYITELMKLVMESTQNKQVPDLREINEQSTLKVW